MVRNSLCLVLLVPAISYRSGAAQLDRDKLPGRQVRISTICIGFGCDHNAKLKLAIDNLHTTDKKGVAGVRDRKPQTIPPEKPHSNKPGPQQRKKNLILQEYAP